MQKTTLSALLIFLSLFLSAQKTGKYNSLLWRISGNGLSKPSYLYGTMHITDSKVFHFTDSVYYGIEQTDGFAAELDIESMMNEFIGAFLNSGRSEEEEIATGGRKIFLVDSLDKKFLSKYKSVLEKKYGKPLKKIRIRDINTGSDLTFTEMLRNGDMNTFMDAWLFDLARKQGKWVGGIEDPEDQFDVLNSISLEEKITGLKESPDDQKKFFDWMIDTYLKQNLDEIDVTDEIWRGSKDLILIKRNKKMARRMDSLAKIRSMFFAVGAAHIPGDEGVVSLLRSQGYTVTPVYSINRIAPEDYNFKQVEIPWVNTGSGSKLYSIEMPGKPVDIYLNSDSSMVMRMYFDVVQMRAFFTAGLSIPPLYIGRQDSLLNNLMKNYTDRGMNVTIKDITINEVTGKEMTGTDTLGNLLRAQFFSSQSMIVMNIISAFKKNMLSGSDPERFFNSFKLDEEEKITGNSKTEIVHGWHRYNLDKYGFSVELPLTYTENKKIYENESWEQHQFTAMDQKDDIFYGMAVSTIKKGYYSNSDSAYFEELAENMITNLEAEEISNRHFTFSGYPACEIKGKKASTNGIIYLKMFFVNKGPRSYLLFTTSAKEDNKDDGTGRFFSSFNFIPGKANFWKPRKPEDKSFGTWSPSEINKEEIQESQYEEKYSILDTASMIQFFIDRETFPPYFWADSDTGFLNDKVKTYISYTDSVIFNTPYTKGNIHGVDLLVKMDGTHNRKRLRAFMNGDTLYSIYSFLPEQYLEQENFKRVFEDFTMNVESPARTLYNKKTMQLMLALQSKDSATFSSAKETLAYVNFSREDIPDLQQALLYPYMDFDTTYYYNIGKDISVKIEELDSSYSSIEFIRKNYPLLSGDREMIKPYLLGLLSQLKTKESYELLKELILKSPPQINKAIYFRNGLYDSVALTKNLYPEIISLTADPALFDFINDITLMMIDSGAVDKSILKSYSNGFLKSGNRILSESPDQLKERYFQYTSFVKLLGLLNSPETNEMLKKFGQLEIMDLKNTVVIAQVTNGETPSADNIKKLASSDQYRKDLYDEFKKIGKESLFPKEFASQKLFGQSAIYSYSSDDDYPPDRIEYIGERTETYLGKKVKIFLYKVCFEDEEQGETCYLGVAGPFSLNKNDLESSNDITDIYWDEEFDTKKINEWVKKIIQRTEEWVKKRDNPEED